MNVIPIKTKQHTNDILIIVLDKDDWSKMTQAAPVQLNWLEMVAQLSVQIIHPTIVICYEPSPMKLMQFLQKKDIIGALKYLQRGVGVADRTIIQATMDGLGRSGNDY